MRIGPILDPAMPQATIDIAIKLRDLTVSYEEKPVLRSISMDVPKGEIVGIIGPNGAGKSTLLKAMLGLIHPDAGDIRYYGKMISECRQLVGYVQHHSRRLRAGQGQVQRELAQREGQVRRPDR